MPNIASCIILAVPSNKGIRISDPLDEQEKDLTLAIAIRIFCTMMFEKPINAPNNPKFGMRYEHVENATKCIEISRNALDFGTLMFHDPKLLEWLIEEIKLRGMAYFGI